MRTLLNFEGSTETTPAAASPTKPTALAEPIPAKSAAQTAPTIANVIPKPLTASKLFSDIFLLEFNIFCIYGKRGELSASACVEFRKQLNEL